MTSKAGSGPVLRIPCGAPIEIVAEVVEGVVSHTLRLPGLTIVIAATPGTVEDMWRSGVEASVLMSRDGPVGP